MIYFVEADGAGAIKIGFVAGEDAADRVRDLQTGSPVPLRLLGTMPGTLQDENDLHRRFASARIHGEWFRPTPELLAIIPPSAAPLACGPVREDVRRVEVRVLTVNKRQFTKAFFEQIPERELVCWKHVKSAIMGSKPLDPAAFELGNAWGRVCLPGYLDCIIWKTTGDSLARYYFYPKRLDKIKYDAEPRYWFHERFGFRAPGGLEEETPAYVRAVGFWKACCARWQSLDQLFVGV